MDELVAPDLLGSPLDDYAAVVHHRDPIGDTEGHIHVVLDQQQRDRPVEAEQEIGEKPSLAAGEAGGRLVEHQHARLAASAIASAT